MLPSKYEASRGIIISSKDSQKQNAQFLILNILSGSFIFFKDEQKANISLTISVMLPFISRETTPLKTYFPMSNKVGRNVINESEEHPEKA